MRNVTESFIESEMPIEFEIDVTLKNNDTLTFDNNSIVANGVTFTDALTDGSSFSLGYCNIGELTVEVNNTNEQFSSSDFVGAIVDVKCYKLINNVKDYVKIGKYLVNEPTQTNGIIKLDCLDYMSLLNVPYNNDIPSDNAMNIVQAICNKFGLTWNSKRFDGYNVNITIPTLENTTYLQLLGYVMQYTCNYAIMRYDTLFIGWYDVADTRNITPIDGGIFGNAYRNEIDGGNFEDYNQEDTFDGMGFDGMGAFDHKIYKNQKETFATDNVVITGIEVDTTNDENGTSYTYGTDGYVLTINDNPLMLNHEKEVAEYIGNKMIGVEFRPFSIETKSNLLYEIGDSCMLVDIKDNIYYSYITNLSYTIGQMEQLQCVAETELLNSKPSFSLVTQAIVKSRENTREQISNYDLAVQRLTELITNSFGVFKTEEKQEDGSTIFYMHNRPNLPDSTTIWKMTSDTLSVSTDGGKTWNAGVDSSGNVLVNVLSAIGINADWVTIGGKGNGDGELTVYNNSGTPIVVINNQGITMADGTSLINASGIVGDIIVTSGASPKEIGVYGYGSGGVNESVDTIWNPTEILLTVDIPQNYIITKAIITLSTLATQWHGYNFEHTTQYDFIGYPRGMKLYKKTSQPYMNAFISSDNIIWESPQGKTQIVSGGFSSGGVDGTSSLVTPKIITTGDIKSYITSGINVFGIEPSAINSGTVRQFYERRGTAIATLSIKGYTKN